MHSPGPCRRRNRWARTKLHMREHDDKKAQAIAPDSSAACAKGKYGHAPRHGVLGSLQLSERHVFDMKQFYLPGQGICRPGRSSLSRHPASVWCRQGHPLCCAKQPDQPVMVPHGPGRLLFELQRPSGRSSRRVSSSCFSALPVSTPCGGSLMRASACLGELCSQDPV